MPDVRIFVGDCRGVLRGLPDQSVHMVVCSPPYYGLRDYGLYRWEGGDPGCPHEPRRWDGPKQTQGAPSGHAALADRLGRKACACGAVRVPTTIWGGDPDCEHAWGVLERGKKGDRQPREGLATNDARGASEYAHGGAPLDGGRFCERCGAWRGCLGNEPTPELYVAHLVEVFREVWRVLRDDGTLWLNLGDSYANDGKWGGATGGKHAGALHGDTRPSGAKRQTTGLKEKDLIGIPWTVAFALRADGWTLRRDIVWEKKAPMPESVEDRCTTSHEYVFHLSKRADYFYDHEAVKEKAAYAHEAGWDPGSNGLGGDDRKTGASTRRFGADPSRRNRRSVWTIASKPFIGAHFATFPPELPEVCIRAGTSERGCCRACGAPWERVAQRRVRPVALVEVKPSARDGGLTAEAGMERTGLSHFKYNQWLAANPPTTLGWRPTCHCGGFPCGPPGRRARLRPWYAARWQQRVEARWPAIVPAVVCDPFGGAGTTGLVAARLGRDAVLAEANPDYAAMAERRITDEAPLLNRVTVDACS